MYTLHLHTFTNDQPRLQLDLHASRLVCASADRASGFLKGGVHPRASGGRGPGSWFLGWKFVAPDKANVLWSQNNIYWRLLESVLLGLQWPMAKCFIWASIGIMINYLVKPIKQKNQNTNPNQREPAPRHHISFSCHFQGEIPPEKKTLESFYISQIISCGEWEASISQIQIITQSTGDYRDKHVLNQITGNPGSPNMVTC